MENKIKKKLKRRGNKLYQTYFFNPDNIINEIINQIDNNEIINENNCETVFNISDKNIPLVYELISYYPKKLKELKYINDETINELYKVYGETISIIKENRDGRTNVRGKITNSALSRAKLYNLPCDIISEDIILVRTCKYLNIPIQYGNSSSANNSPSIDKINPNLGYVKGNIEIISMLANNMKSSATIEELLTFSKNVLKIYQR
jgi:hypothetical protein